MKIAILECDTPREFLYDVYGRYGQMYTQWMSAHFAEAEFDAFAVHQDGVLPAVSDYDGYMLTGSRHDLSGRQPWMLDIEDLLRAARAEGIPVAGICFGHQIMANAYGGTVERAPGGWVLGRQCYQPRQGDAVADLYSFAIHQDQVVKRPEGVRVVHGNARVENGRLEYDFPAMSVQYHPEFFPDFYRKLMHYCLESRMMDAGLIERALAEVSDGSDGGVIARQFAEFFRHHHRQRVG